MKFLLCLIPFLFSSCSVHLQQSSRSWDDPLPSQVLTKKNRTWRSAKKTESKKKTVQPKKKLVLLNKEVAQARSNKNINSKYKVSVPELSEEITSYGAAADILQSAEKHLGVPYVYGGSSPQKGFDCSGLVFHVFQENGKSVQRTADKQYLQGQTIDKENMQPGDLVFFSHSGKYVDHVGIYAGDDLFIHAPRKGRTVSYDSLDTGYYRTHFRSAKRLL